MLKVKHSHNQIFLNRKCQTKKLNDSINFIKDKRKNRKLSNDSLSIFQMKKR